MSMKKLLSAIACVLLLGGQAEWVLGMNGAEGQQDNGATCLVCLDPKPSSDFITLKCGHKPLCRGCLSGMLKNGARDKDGTGVSCPVCKTAIIDTDIKKINSQLLEDVQNAQLQEFLKTQTGIKHCPTAGCQNIFIKEGRAAWTYTCDACKHNYCAECLILHGRGISCEKAKQMQKAGLSDNEKKDIEYIEKISKKCPNPGCNWPIEKNGGCDHMTCPKCHWEFCWICLKPRKTHVTSPYGNNNPRYHVCGVGDKIGDRVADDNYPHGGGFFNVGNNPPASGRLLAFAAGAFSAGHSSLLYAGTVPVKDQLSDFRLYPVLGLASMAFSWSLPFSSDWTVTFTRLLAVTLGSGALWRNLAAETGFRGVQAVASSSPVANYDRGFAFGAGQVAGFVAGNVLPYYFTSLKKFKRIPVQSGLQRA